ncbi:MAG: hypothetical protein JW741_01150 [Sedimentisphaerales bacterium]|nr:hypothetical protein [Sedimentisphaerales bacterium]
MFRVLRDLVRRKSQIMAALFMMVILLPFAMYSKGHAYLWRLAAYASFGLLSSEFSGADRNLRRVLSSLPLSTRWVGSCFLRARLWVPAIAAAVVSAILSCQVAGIRLVEVTPLIGDAVDDGGPIVLDSLVIGLTAYLVCVMCWVFGSFISNGVKIGAALKLSGAKTALFALILLLVAGGCIYLCLHAPLTWDAVTPTTAAVMGFGLLASVVLGAYRFRIDEKVEDTIARASTRTFEEKAEPKTVPAPTFDNKKSRQLQQLVLTVPIFWIPIYCLAAVAYVVWPEVVKSDFAAPFPALQMLQIEYKSLLALISLGAISAVQIAALRTPMRVWRSLPMSGTKLTQYLVLRIALACGLNLVAAAPLIVLFCGRASLNLLPLVAIGSFSVTLLTQAIQLACEKDSVHHSVAYLSLVLPYASVLFVPSTWFFAICALLAVVGVVLVHLCVTRSTRAYRTVYDPAMELLKQSMEGVEQSHG